MICDSRFSIILRLIKFVASSSSTNKTLFSFIFISIKYYWTVIFLRIVKLNMLPSLVESTHILPPCKSIIFSQWERPIPFPRIDSVWRRLKSWKFCLFFHNAIILDRKCQSSSTSFPFILISGILPFFVNFKELIKFCNTSLISVGYPLRIGTNGYLGIFLLYNHWHIRENLIKNFTQSIVANSFTFSILE
jgi:hypothetical protein